MAVYIVSDPHFSHENMIKRYRGFEDIKLHDDMIIKNWNNTVSKRDKVFLLGDLSMQKNVSNILVKLNGQITIVGGNHDKPNHLKKYLELSNVQAIVGIVKYKGYWLTHAPIHSIELRGCKNIHGHIHKNKIMKFFGLVRDYRYINVCMDHTDYTPILFDDILTSKYR